MHPTAVPYPDIHALADRLQSTIDTRWKALLEEHADRLADAYARGGDLAYGSYLGLLFRPLNRELKRSGLRLIPDLPGNMERSREWGSDAAGTDQQRWMWSRVERGQGEPLGTLVTVVYHDHTRFRLPRAPRVLALEATDDAAVIRALSQRHHEFETAPEFTVEVAAYLRSQQGGSAH
ncbi:hypothetical protein HNR42_000908 [Deinobacterium chartae]|uniref:Uncharacterized protein n=1 Tax=Deinobacterium chartae TaxID=521158 RepID=A0A841HVG5_9DEIO|nr:DUF6022 family protein [Deinobacterium chartae]MBB6097491.1 hypothetical protein [Deinobacterium chartae]